MNVSNLFISSSEQIPKGFFQLGKTTLGSAGTTITLDNLPARKNLKIIVHVYSRAGAGGTVAMNFNDDGAGNYDYRTSTNTGATALVSGATAILIEPNSGTSATYTVIEMCNVDGKYKRGFFRTTSATDTESVDGTLNWGWNAGQISKIVITSAVNMGADSYIEVFGAD